MIFLCGHIKWGSWNKSFFFFFLIKGHSFFLKLFIYLFIFGWVGSSFLCEGFSLVAASGDHSSTRCAGLSLSQPLVAKHGSRRAGSVVLWLMGPVAPRHVGSSQTRAQTRVPCIGRPTLNHCATSEAQVFFF